MPGVEFAPLTSPDSLRVATTMIYRVGILLSRPAALGHLSLDGRRIDRSFLRILRTRRAIMPSLDRTKCILFEGSAIVSLQGASIWVFNHRHRPIVSPAVYGIANARL